MLSGMFPKIGSAAQSSLSQVQSMLKNNTSQMNSAAKSLGDMKSKLDSLYKRRDSLVNLSDLRAANREIENMERRMTRMQNAGRSGGGGGMLGSIIGGNLIASGVQAAASAAKQVITDSIGAAMQYSMQEKSFQVLTGDAGRGKALADELRAMKQSTLVGGGVYANAQTMLGFGVKQQDVLKNLRQIGDIGMGDQERMAQLTLARSQVTASGKLMGQDLLQFINAGFNPLNVMAEKWKDFGFKSKVTIGQLKDMVAEGKISSAMVDKAFETATSKGGQFYKMMDQIGQTAGGAALKLKGQWAATQIDIGNALMPLASSMMSAANDALHFLNIHKSVPEKLREEQKEITFLTNSITKLNEGNVQRSRLLDMLKSKYPEYFSMIDTETIKNKELLAIHEKINKVTKDRIDLELHKSKVQEYGNRADELRGLSMRAALQAQDLIDNGNRMDRGNNIFDPKTYSQLSLMDRLRMMQLGIPYDESPGGLFKASRLIESMASNVTQKQKGEQRLLDSESIIDLRRRAMSLLQSAPDQKELWGSKAAANRSALMKEMQRIVAEDKKGLPFAMRDWTKLRTLMDPTTSTDGSGGAAALGDAVSEVGKRVTGGGQKVVNINFKNVVETMTNTIASGQDFVKTIEPDLEQAMNRILQNVR